MTLLDFVSCMEIVTGFTCASLQSFAGIERLVLITQSAQAVSFRLTKWTRSQASILGVGRVTHDANAWIWRARSSMRIEIR